MRGQRHPVDASAPDSSSGDPIRVLLVDDEPGLADLVADHLEREFDAALQTYTETAVTDALAVLDARPVDCIVSDYQMPGMDGLELLERVREDRPDLPFVLFTGKGSEEIASEAVSAGVTDYLQKGGGPEQYALLANRIRNAVERHRARRALEAREERFRRLIEGSSDLISVLDESFRFEYLSPSVEAILGHDPATLEGESAFDYVHPDDRDRAAAAVERIVAEPDGTVTETFRFRDSDGDWRHIEATGRNLLDAPAVEGIVVNARDVTERVEQERVRERYERIVETVPDGVYVTDADGRYVAVNDRIEEVTGYDREELIGTHGSELVPEESLAELEAWIADLLADDGDDFARIEYPIETASGATILVETRLALRPTGPDGEFRGTVGVSRDVTERIVREWRLERQNDRLEEFTEVVSHDLRNPLSVATAHLDLARETADPETDGRLATVTDAHERMDALISDLLALARSGRTVEGTEPVTLVKASRDAWKTTATDGATLTVDSSTVLRADERQFRQLLENLFRNSIEHGAASSRPEADDAIGHGARNPRASVGEDVADHGHGSARSRSQARENGPAAGSAPVDIRVGVLADGDGFYVADDGPGIPEADRERVFEHGYTTDAGTGLGLAIVRNVAEAHGWSVAVTDGEDGGARFEFTDVEFA